VRFHRLRPHEASPAEDAQADSDEAILVLDCGTPPAAK
jgi:hypothetical protein